MVFAVEKWEEKLGQKWWNNTELMVESGEKWDGETMKTAKRRWKNDESCRVLQEFEREDLVKCCFLLVHARIVWKVYGGLLWVMGVAHLSFICIWFINIYSTLIGKVLAIHYIQLLEIPNLGSFSCPRSLTCSWARWKTSCCIPTWRTARFR